MVDDYCDIYVEKIIVSTLLGRYLLQNSNNIDDNNDRSKTEGNVNDSNEDDDEHYNNDSN